MPGSRGFRDLMFTAVALALVAFIVFAGLRAGQGPGPRSSPAAAGSSAPASSAAASSAAASSASVNTATANPASAGEPPQQAAAQQANLGGAVTPTNSLTVTGWNTGQGGAASRAVASQLGLVLMMHDANQVSALRQACRALATSVTAALAAPPIPDSAMQLYYKQALTEIGTGATDCQAGISSELSGDEDLQVHQDAAVMNRALSELFTGSRELYKATAFLKSLK